MNSAKLSDFPHISKENGEKIFSIPLHLVFFRLMQTHDSYSIGISAIPEILLHGDALLHHLLVSAGGVNHVQAVIVPHSDAQVGDVKPGSEAGDGDDVAVVDSIPQLTAVGQLCCGDIAVFSACQVSLLFSNEGQILWMALQRDV